jgi:hypothetical protein
MSSHGRTGIIVKYLLSTIYGISQSCYKHLGYLSEEELKGGNR